MKYLFWGLMVVGMAACQFWGIGRTLERVGGQWGSPWMVAGSVVGTVIVLAAVAFATGFRPGAVTEQTYVVVLLGLIALKVAIAAASAAGTAVLPG